MIVSASGFAISKYFNKYSLDGMKLKEKGILPILHSASRIFSDMKVADMIEKNFLTVFPDNSLGDLIELIPKTSRNIFPVVNDEGRLEGLVSMDNIRPVMFDTAKYNSVSVLQLMQVPPAYIETDDDMETIFRKFDETHAWNLPVVENGIYIGFISKSFIFEKYREKLAGHEEE